MDGTPCAVKVACTVWSRGKVGDDFKDLPMAIEVGNLAILRFNRLYRVRGAEGGMQHLNACRYAELHGNKRE